MGKFYATGMKIEYFKMGSKQEGNNRPQKTALSDSLTMGNLKCGTSFSGPQWNVGLRGCVGATGL